tara:strand:+ start:13083 stop:13952 length:870 start_codon:yes stop_codon:yes gene_type:complete
MIKKQVLGTAQFGINNYGVSNFSEKKTYNELYSTFNLAFEKGVKYFDTAPEYKSEKILGRFIKSNKIQKEIKVITKVPSLDKNNKDFFSQIKKSIEQSLEDLNIDQIFCLLMHDQQDIIKIQNDKNLFLEIKKKYNIKNIGFSVYDINISKKVLKSFPNASLQFPFNPLNNKFISLKKNKKNLFFGRSIFCQGFLTNQRIKKLKKKLILSHKKYFKFIQDAKIDPVKLCLDYAYSNKSLNFIVYGVRNIDELKKVIEYKPKKILNNTMINKIKFFFKNNDVDPRTWCSR